MSRIFNHAYHPLFIKPSLNLNHNTSRMGDVFRFPSWAVCLGKGLSLLDITLVLPFVQRRLLPIHVLESVYTRAEILLTVHFDT
jgi:hypothetical protein